MSPNALIAARPHFRREADDLYFFLSERRFHTLTGAEAEIWNKLQHGPVASTMLPDREALRSMAEAGLIEVIEPIPEQNRRQILVVEPHCDDAALSIGGTMWKMRHEAEFHLLTMASRSNYTTAFHLHRNFFDRSAITAMRTAEGELFTRHLGGHYYCAGLSEATLRYEDSDWNLDFFNAHEVPIASLNNRRASAPVLDAWTAKLKAFLSGHAFEELWLPLGAGTHSDHDLARNAAFRSLLEDPRDAVVRLYEDVPYGAQFQEHTDRILKVLGDAGATLAPWYQDISAEFDNKVALLSIFASQFKVSSIRAGVERSAEPDAGHERVERLWTLERLPRQLRADELWIGAPAVAKAAAGLREFRKGASAARRVAIFAIGAAGRWPDDLSALNAVFPRATFVIYAGPRVCSEFERLSNGLVEVHCLDGRTSSWLKAALREAAPGHRIVIASDAMAKARALRMLWPMGRTIVVSAMDDLSQALANS